MPAITVNPFKQAQATNSAGPAQRPLSQGNLRELLSAVIFNQKNHRLDSPADHLVDFLSNDLDLKRLDNDRVFSWLGWIGRPWQIRPLHKQVAYSRAIILTEQADMHLLWEGSTIYLKPLPRYILDAEFWEANLVCTKNCDCSDASKNVDCSRKVLYSSALGFMYSYMRLIQYESDFDIALQQKLVPRGLEWQTWLDIMDKIITKDAEHNILSLINRRYHFGELRLQRVNWLFRLDPWLPEGLWAPNRGYYYPYTEYSQRFKHNAEILFTFFAYASIILAAMQVGLGIDSLNKNPRFLRMARASMDLTLYFMYFSTGRIGLVLLLLVVDNGLATFRYYKKGMKAWQDKAKGA